MGNVDTGSTSTVSNSKEVKSAVNNIAGQIGGLAKPGATTYVAPSAATTGGWAASLAAANDPIYSGSLASAMGRYGNRAAGNELGANDPGYATLRAKLANDVMTSTNTSFNNSGMFGSDSNQKAAASGLTDSLGALDYQQLRDSRGDATQATNMLSQIFQSQQLPSSIQQAIGSAQDQSAQAKQTGELDWNARLASALAGTSTAAGSTTTESKPLWLSMLGIGASAL